MKRALLLSAGWILAAGALWVSMLLLDVYWNLVDWDPRLDSATAGMLAGATAALGGIWALTRCQSGRVIRAISLLLCLGLLGVATYACRSEALSKGWFGREILSPAWYRIGRLLLMALPVLLWSLAVRRRSPPQVSDSINARSAQSK